MRVTRMIERAEEHLAFVRLAVSVGILKIPNVRNAPGNAPVFAGIDSDGNVQAVGEGRDLVGAPVVVGIFEDFDGVAAGAVGGHGVGILLRHRDPEPSPGIEGHIHRLEDLRLGGEKLNFKTRREMEGLLFLFRALPRRRAHILGEGIGGVERGQTHGPGGAPQPTSDGANEGL